MKKISYLLFLLLISRFSFNAQQLFSDKNLITGQTQTAISIATADISGNGFQDVVSASFYEHKVTWFENLGNNNFGPQRNVTTSEYNIKKIIVADLNGDQKMDVITGSEGNTISWYRNEGNGNFSQKIIITGSVSNITSLVAVDIDGDEDIDIISSSLNDGKTAWYENDGNGFFGPQILISASPSGATSVHAADIDCDGDLDLFSSSFADGKLAWHENMGDGIFGPQNIITSILIPAVFIQTIDYDNDNLLDVISGSLQGNISCYKNLGDGVFADPIVICENIVITRPDCVYPLDVDNDGLLDIVAGSYNIQKIAWFRNEGNGTFSSENLISNENQIREIEIADMDNDGVKDIVTTTFANGQVAWYKNQLNGDFSPIKTISSDIYDITVGDAKDLNNDGFADIVIGSEEEKSLSWFENDKNGGFKWRKFISVQNESPHSISIIDLDNDSDNDIVCSYYYEDKIVWYKNDGNGNFSPEIVLIDDVFLAIDFDVADFDKDGDLDIAYNSRFDNQTGIILNKGDGTFEERVIIGDEISYLQELKIADINNDGYDDVIVLSGLNTIKLNLFLNSQNGEFQAPFLLYPEPGYVTSFSPVDIDNDEDIDIVLSNTSGIMYLENNGLGSFSAPQSLYTSSNPTLFHTIDLDLDEHIDIITFSNNEDELVWLKNDGLGNFEPYQLETNISSSIGIILTADLNNDCDLEIITTTLDDGILGWHSNYLNIPSSENIELSTFEIYPNPMKNICTISYKHDEKPYCNDFVYKAFLYSTTGQIIRKYDYIQGNDFTFDRKNLAPGHYILKIVDGLKIEEFILIVN